MMLWKWYNISGASPFSLSVRISAGRPSRPVYLPFDIALTGSAISHRLGGSPGVSTIGRCAILSMMIVRSIVAEIVLNGAETYQSIIDQITISQ